MPVTMYGAGSGVFPVMINTPVHSYTVVTQERCTFAGLIQDLGE